MPGLKENRLDDVHVTCERLPESTRSLRKRHLRRGESVRILRLNDAPKNILPQATADLQLNHERYFLIQSEDATQAAKMASVPRLKQGTNCLMRKLHLVTVFVLALSAASHAADLPLPLKAPTYAPPPLLSWEGSYVGILGG